jgi:hypothetical protein
MDSAVTEFLGVEKNCTYFQDTDFTQLHFGRGESNPMLDFFGEWTREDRVTTKLSSITLSKFLTAYLSNWNGEIIKYLNSIGNQIISPNDITIQQLASFYGHTGGKGNLGKKRTEEHRANISAGNLGKQRTEEQRANISAGNLGKQRTEEHLTAEHRAAHCERIWKGKHNKRKLSSGSTEEATYYAIDGADENGRYILIREIFGTNDLNFRKKFKRRNGKRSMMQFHTMEAIDELYLQKCSTKTCTNRKNFSYKLCQTCLGR